MSKNYIDRMKNELEELNIKIDKLSEFFKSSTYLDLPLEDKILLSDQYNCMHKYSQILLTRIKRT